MGREESPSGPPARPSTAIPGPCIRIPGSIAKNRKSALQPISAQLAAQLRSLIAANAPGFQLAFVKLVPKCPAFRKDCLAAGITIVDAEGRRVDMHALRKTFGAHLVLANVEPRVVMELMRHSDLKLTMKTYMDASLLTGPVLAAVAKLPWSRPAAAEITA